MVKSQRLWQAVMLFGGAALAVAIEFGNRLAWRVTTFGIVTVGFAGYAWVGRLRRRDGWRRTYVSDDGSVSDHGSFAGDRLLPWLWRVVVLIGMSVLLVAMELGGQRTLTAGGLGIMMIGFAGDLWFRRRES